MSYHRHPVVLAAALLALAAGAAQAQLYRSVGPDGTVTYTDQPPPSARTGAAASPGGDSDANAASPGALPYDLGQVASRYPVTLYTSKDCAPCDQGRTLLTGRGIPFSEKTISTSDDLAALKRLGGDGNLPMLTIAGQRLTGFSDADWTQYLNAAGYPKTSQLPGGYQRPEATPLVAIQIPPAPASSAGETDNASAADAPSEPAVAPARQNADNPAGISF